MSQSTSHITVPPPLRDFLAGTMGGFAGKLLDYPLDTVKVLLQTQHATHGGTSSAHVAGGNKPPVIYRGAWHCLRHTVETKGVSGLYKGLSSPLLGSMAENAVLFWMYSHCKRWVAFASGGTDPIIAAHTADQRDEENMTLLQLSLAGAGAGFGAAFVLTPVELVKCRLQVQNSMTSGFRVYSGPIDVIVQTIKTEGITRGLYRGHMSTLLREIPGNFVWYGTYEGVCKLMIPPGGTKSDLGPGAHLLGGALAGVGYWTAFYPADTIKSLIQVHPDHSGRGFFEIFKTVLQEEGVRGLYRGWGVTAARAAPAHAAIFTIYEQSLRWMS
ncbi:mitochondrial carrier protein [Nitzschia inconspicua]|uniref:Mitochondrial carrier protein n=1 Tax=Nitzschia inconspicua TaxID=303405 RepID=A0A9K3LDR1_9STRA|nr:mitochondrial carrier protein [Nitzschia inconspicua]